MLKPMVKTRPLSLALVYFQSYFKVFFFSIMHKISAEIHFGIVN